MIDPIKVKLDPYEQDLEDNFEKMVPLTGEAWEKEKKRLEQAAENTMKQLNKSKRVSIRVRESDLRGLKSRAAEKGLPYQTLLGSLIHQYVSGQIDVTL